MDIVRYLWVRVRMVGKTFFKRPVNLYIPEAVNNSSAFLLEVGVYAAPPSRRTETDEIKTIYDEKN